MGSNPTLSAITTMSWTDTHCHLNHPDLLSEWEAVVARAQQGGVQRFVVVGYDLESSQRAVQLAEQHPSLYATVGIHPHDATQWNSATHQQLVTLCQHPRVVALGEIGLDFYRDFSPREVQYEAFHAQMRLAQTLQLPVVIHCRDAYDPLLETLAEYPAVRGVLHCFSGTEAHARRGLELGYWLGIGGVVTFRSANSLRAIVREVPRERIVLETDAPYLAPHPYRGKRNEPAYIPLIAGQVAALWGMPLEALAELTEQNVRQLFPRMTQSP